MIARQTVYPCNYEDFLKQVLRLEGVVDSPILAINAAATRDTRSELRPLLIKGKGMPFVGKRPMVTPILSTAWAQVRMVSPKARRKGGL